MRIGQSLVSQATFVTKEGELTDPTVVKASVKLPNGDIEEFVYNTDPELTRVSLGVYELPVHTNLVGRYTLRWEGSGLLTAVKETRWRVYPSNVIPPP